MKKIAILLGLSLLISMGAFAQKNKRTSAYMYNKNGEYKNAKEAIDAAAVHEKTMYDPKTWMYRGIIYYNIQTNGLADLLTKDALDVSYESLKKASEYDEKGTYKDEINLYMNKLSIEFFNRGIQAFQMQDYDAALVDFEKNYKIGESVGRIDTITAFNIGMAGVYGKKPDIAAKYLGICIDNGYSDARVYKYYSKSIKQLGDTARALEVIKTGRKEFPEDLGLMLELAQIYLETGQNTKLRETLLEAVKTDSENPNLYLILGQTYDNDGDFDKAIEYYNKSIDLGANSSTVYYNIGVIYSNAGKAYLDSANNLPLNKVKEYDTLVGKANAELEQGMPYFEKALELNPDDKDSRLALKNIYIQLKMNDKLKELIKED